MAVAHQPAVAVGHHQQRVELAGGAKRGSHGGNRLGRGRAAHRRRVGHEVGERDKHGGAPQGTRDDDSAASQRSAQSTPVKKAAATASMAISISAR